MTNLFGMTRTPAGQVAREIRERLPNLVGDALPWLLYLAQGHHLAHTGHPLFAEPIRVRRDEVVVRRNLIFIDMAGSGGGRLGEAELNTIGYVASRYGTLSPWWQIRGVVTGQNPWLAAAKSGVVDLAELRHWFVAADRAEPGLDRDEVRVWLADAHRRFG